MPKIQYQVQRFSAGSIKLIELANEIIADYQGQGFDLTLRQLFYQFVSRDLIPNKQSEYKRLGSIINDARMAGLIDWYAIVDRTRGIRGNQHSDSPEQILASAKGGYQIDKWENQEFRTEVWIEKDALSGVISGVCRELDVKYFSCRGYTSQSEMWVAAQRLLSYAQAGQKVSIIHLGDHDPSGIDMTRDIFDRLELFMGEQGEQAEIHRIALNMPQIKKYNPPPNPAKETDSRFTDYIAKYGSKSYELDALNPPVIVGLIRDEVLSLRDDEKWEESLKKEELHKAKIQSAIDMISDKKKKPRKKK